MWYVHTMENIDVYKNARNLIREFGNAASVEAAMRSDGMLDCGDPYAAGQWNKVMQAIKFLQGT
jgi:hypothetical protein